MFKFLGTVNRAMPFQYSALIFSEAVMLMTEILLEKIRPLVTFVKMVPYARSISIPSLHPVNFKLQTNIYFFFFFYDLARFVSCGRIDDITPVVQSESEECK